MTPVAIVEDVFEVLGPWAVLTLIATAAVFLSLLVRYVVGRVFAGADKPLAAILVRYVGRPAIWFLPLIAVSAAIPLLELPDAHMELLEHLVSLLFVTLVTWLCANQFYVLEAYVSHKNPFAVRDNLKARKVHTQVRVIRQIGIVVVLLLGISMGLLSFEPVRQVGATLLAGAGVAGIIIGLAAQRSLGLILSGLQLAITQPIRLDDVLIAEGEWGKVEEITITYVVLRIWDQRRMVLPCSYFLEKPFQNWTRVTSELIGTVFLYVDYDVPVNEVRLELTRILSKESLWDGRVGIVQVTEAQTWCMELRALVSAADAPSLWDLRCNVREGLITWAARTYPDHLPRMRASLMPEHRRERDAPPAP
ncbi:MAG: mechanosensitive ion channel family protein [Spirochaetaceae bacterium]